MRAFSPAVYTQPSATCVKSTSRWSKGSRCRLPYEMLDQDMRARDTQLVDRVRLTAHAFRRRRACLEDDRRMPVGLISVRSPAL
jgi:hypothetical protein